MIQKIQCEVCRQVIGAVETDTLQQPLTAKQILSPFPERGIPRPFHESLQIHELRCPFGKVGQAGHRPFITEDELITDTWNTKTNDFVRIQIGKPFRLVTDMASMNQELIDKAMPDPQPIICEYCGKEYAHRSSKSRHKRTCKEKPDGPS